MAELLLNQQSQKNGKKEMNFQKQGVPSTAGLGDPSPHIPPRKHIIDEDYDLTQNVFDAAAFVRLSYQDTDVLQIGNMTATTKQLCANVTNGFISDEVLSFQIHVDNTNMQTHMY